VRVGEVKREKITGEKNRRAAKERGANPKTRNDFQGSHTIDNNSRTTYRLSALPKEDLHTNQGIFERALFWLCMISKAEFCAN